MNWLIIVLFLIANDILVIVFLCGTRRIESPIRISIEKTMWTKTPCGFTLWLGPRGKTFIFRNYKKLCEYDGKVFRYFSHGGCTVIGIDIDVEYKKHKR